MIMNVALLRRFRAAARGHLITVCSADRFGAGDQVHTRPDGARSVI
jgi:hypothetical protein